MKELVRLPFVSLDKLRPRRNRNKCEEWRPRQGSTYGKIFTSRDWKVVLMINTPTIFYRLDVTLSMRSSCRNVSLSYSHEQILERKQIVKSVIWSSLPSPLAPDWRALPPLLLLRLRQKPLESPLEVDLTLVH
ncbi:hypothetical protein RRG08_058770 [Elysia crispata]|uniref:Uncharacterized protein n=1 Tax=Elysia crispata TaxID=231223 RepID=A0AAE0YX13_9GAST|nr:hypothetical protein RRG08_058770 [Elysia crispata]